MRLAEPLLQRHQVERSELDTVELDRDLAALARVPHVENEADILVADLDVLVVEPAARPRRECLERR